MVSHDYSCKEFLHTYIIELFSWGVTLLKSDIKLFHTVLMWNFCVKRAIGTHLLQTGGVELCLINDLNSHLEAKQVCITLLHCVPLITLDVEDLKSLAQTLHRKYPAIFLHTQAESYNLTALTDKHTITTGDSCIIEKAYRQGHTHIHTSSWSMVYTHYHDAYSS